MGSGKPRAKAVGIRVAVNRCNYCRDNVLTVAREGTTGGIMDDHGCPGNLTSLKAHDFRAHDLARIGLRITERNRR